MPNDDPRRDTDLRRVRLLMMRGRLRDARAALEGAATRSPGDPEVDAVRRDLMAADAAARDRAASRRGWRRTLHLDTGWRRAVAVAGCIALLGFGGWDVVRSVRDGVRKGFDTRITTMRLAGRRYRRRQPWTRPIYVDTIYGSLLVVLGVGGLLVVRRLSADAQDWEWLDTDDRPEYPSHRA